MKKIIVQVIIFMNLLFFMLYACDKKSDNPMNKFENLTTVLTKLIDESGAEVGIAFIELSTGRELYINAKLSRIIYHSIIGEPITG
ncbi:hypothetical protein IIC38_16690 [candidate division KSB1 bacterium]|nr:hypothetical protein [candidate division KSB1 bacterium]